MNSKKLLYLVTVLGMVLIPALSTPVQADDPALPARPAGGPVVQRSTWGAIKALYRGAPAVQGASAESTSATVGKIEISHPASDIFGRSVYYISRGQEIAVLLDWGDWVNVIYTPCRAGNSFLTFWNTTWWMKSLTGVFIKPYWTNAPCYTSPAGPWNNWATWYVQPYKQTKTLYAGSSNIAFRFYVGFGNYNPCPDLDCGEALAAIHLLVQ